MKAKDVMTQRVISIEPSATILQAARLMLQNRISGLPVVDGSGNLVGVVDGGRFSAPLGDCHRTKAPELAAVLAWFGPLADEYVHTHGRKIDEVMTRDPYSIAEDTPLEEIVRLMEQHRIKRLPVVRGRRLVGIVSRANLLHALASVARDVKPGATSDEQIRAGLLNELDKQKWAPVALVNVVVRNGIVELCGSITDERQRAALKVMAENVPGVKSVRDHLVWVEPMSGTLLYSPEDETQKAVAS